LKNKTSRRNFSSSQLSTQEQLSKGSLQKPKKRSSLKLICGPSPRAVIPKICPRLADGSDPWQVRRMKKKDQLEILETEYTKDPLWNKDKMK
jgi:hypothetical protein